ncbi:hypothetical protein [Burkholderia glumae]|uniref:hypothetical protein n=1 Tax=Burkholderia glumae TaxID=337 RepID=UPI00215082D9|nr:hypothetical protein [Burkholderia glumae]
MAVRLRCNLNESYVTKETTSRRVNEDKGKCDLLHRNIPLHFFEIIKPLFLLYFFEGRGGRETVRLHQRGA